VGPRAGLDKNRGTDINKTVFYTKVVHHLTFTETDVILKLV
jgi:hypothetical protein